MRTFNPKLLIVMTLFSCSGQTTEKAGTRPQDSAFIAQVEPTMDVDDDGGPPFSDSCACKFGILGSVVIGNRMDMIIAGKGWNPDYYSCSWTWGEFINNEFPNDTTITDFRIHLVDIDKIDGPLKSFLLSKQFSDHLIATYARPLGEKQMICIFDPNQTGKYPKPKQWTE